jgi:hypothetical protein
MNDILNDLIHLNLEECTEVLKAVAERIKILTNRERTVNTIRKPQKPADEKLV